MNPVVPETRHRKVAFQPCLGISTLTRRSSLRTGADLRTPFVLPAHTLCPRSRRSNLQSWLTMLRGHSFRRNADNVLWPQSPMLQFNARAWRGLIGMLLTHQAFVDRGLPRLSTLSDQSQQRYQKQASQGRRSCLSSRTTRCQTPERRDVRYPSVIASVFTVALLLQAFRMPPRRPAHAISASELLRTPEGIFQPLLIG